MNIFHLDENPEICAIYHCDKHIVKMVLETAQLLCTAHHLSHSTAPYKAAYINHPCAIWTRQSYSNYKYLVTLGLELSKEYTYRYEKKHKAGAVIEYCRNSVPALPDIGFTLPPLCMPEQYKLGDAITSYRAYYNGEKHFAAWKKREIPHWYSKQ